MAYINVENFRFVPLMRHLSGRCKISQKKFKEQIKFENYFPPKGHNSCVLSVYENSGGEEEMEILVSGGTRKNEQVSSSFFLFSFTSDEDDFNIKKCIEPKRSGSLMSFLDHAAMVPINKDLIFVWSGLDSKFLETRPEPIEIKLNRKKIKRDKRALMLIVPFTKLLLMVLQNINTK